MTSESRGGGGLSVNKVVSAVLSIDKVVFSHPGRGRSIQESGGDAAQGGEHLRLCDAR